MNWLLSLLHVTVNYADVTVDDTDILCRRVRILFGTLTDLHPLNEQPQEFRCQLINASEPLCLFNEGLHICCRCFQLCQPFLFYRNSFLQRFLFGVVASR